MKKIVINELQQDVSKKAAEVKGGSSGLPTGKRQHKPVSVTRELDKSSTL